MICECGSERIQWDRSLRETKCPDCGNRNCHVIEPEEQEYAMTNPITAASLRELAKDHEYMGNRNTRHTLIAVADYIESLERERGELKNGIAVKDKEFKALAEAQLALPTQWAYDQACAALEKHKQRATQAEQQRDQAVARVARLEEALEWYAIKRHYWRIGEGNDSEIFMDRGKRARQALSRPTSDAPEVKP